MKIKKVCYMADMAHHYRRPIFIKMVDELGCDFYFGEKGSTVKSFNVKQFSGFKGRLRYLKIFGPFHFLWGATRSSLKYDVVILLGDPHGLHNWIICVVSKLLGRSVILWTHGFYGKERALRRVFKLIFFKLADKVWVYGQRSKNLLVREGVSSHKVDVVFNSLDYDEQVSVLRSSPYVNELEGFFDNAFPIACYVGRVQSVKRLDLVLRAISLLRNQGLYVNFVIVGDKVDDCGLTKMVHDLGLCEQVYFYGACYSEVALKNIFNSSHVCVSPGNVGLTAIHSLTYGCPVITHDNFDRQMPEAESISEGITGGFFKQGNVEDLAKKIQDWVFLEQGKRDLVRIDCMREVANHWNPKSQVSVMKKSLGEL